MADQGGCSANEATSFASVSVAKRLCRIVRVVDYEIAVFITILKVTPLRRLHLIRAAKAAHLLLKEKAFIVVRFLRSLALLPNYCHPPCLISAPNHVPVAADSAAGRRACAARPRGKAGSERRKACFHPGGSGFHLPCGVARATPCFHPIDFYVTHRFFGTFLTQESTVIPVSPLVFPHQNAPGRISAGRNEFALEAAVEGAALTAYARSPRGRTDRPCRPL